MLFLLLLIEQRSICGEKIKGVVFEYVDLFIEFNKVHEIMFCGGYNNIKNLLTVLRFFFLFYLTLLKNVFFLYSTRTKIVVVLK